MYLTLRVVAVVVIRREGGSKVVMLVVLVLAVEWMDGWMDERTLMKMIGTQGNLTYLGNLNQRINAIIHHRLNLTLPLHCRLLLLLLPITVLAPFDRRGGSGWGGGGGEESVLTIYLSLRRGQLPPNK